MRPQLSISHTVTFFFLFLPLTQQLQLPPSLPSHTVNVVLSLPLLCTRPDKHRPSHLLSVTLFILSSLIAPPAPLSCFRQHHSYPPQSPTTHTVAAYCCEALQCLFCEEAYLIGFKWVCDCIYRCVCLCVYICKFMWLCMCVKADGTRSNMWEMIGSWVHDAIRNHGSIWRIVWDGAHLVMLMESPRM